MSSVPHAGSVRARALALVLPSLLATLLLAPPAVAAPLDPVRVASSEDAAGAGFEVVTAPVVEGAPVVGSTLVVVTPAWSLPDVTTTYQWLRDGEPVEGATRSTYPLDTADVGHALSVLASGTLGADVVSSLSPATAPVRIPSATTASGHSDAAGSAVLDVIVAAAAAGEDLGAGTVEVSEGGAALATGYPDGGSASFTLLELTPGPHVLTVAYRGTDRVAASSTTVTVQVKAAAALVVTSSSPGIGRLTLTTRVTSGGAPVSAGTVVVREGAAVVVRPALEGGVATWAGSGLKPGAHRYTVEYGGTAAVAPTSRTVAAVVRDRATASIAVSASSTSVGRLALDVRVTSAGQAVTSGSVKLSEGKRTVATLKLAKGRATWSASGLKPGRHTYTLGYAGTSAIKPAQKSLDATVRAKVKPSLTVTGSSAGAGKVALKVAVKASGQSSLGGTVTIKEGSKTLKSGLEVKSGKASWSASKVKPGRHTYTVLYSGTSQVTSGTTTVAVTVAKPVALVDYANCSELNAVHPHGVGRPGAVDKVSGSTPKVTTFLRHTKLYELNDESDRDEDGIACEKL